MTSRTIVQLESFYPQVLQSLYQRLPQLAEQSFDTQLAQMLATGFSGGHNVAPYMNPAQWRSQYIVLNGVAAQQRWAIEHGLSAHAPAREIVLAQLRHYQPDVLYLSDIPGFDFSILAELSKRPFVVGWHATSVSDRTPWSSFDLVLSGISRIREEVLQRGAKAAVRYMPAAPAFVATTLTPPRRQGVVFSGSFYGGIHDQRAQQFRQLSQAVSSIGLDIHTPQPFALDAQDAIRFHPAVFGHDVLSLYASHPVVLDSRGNFNLADNGGPRETSNMRIFEATRAGSLLLTEFSPNLSDYFELGQEIETYRSFDELVDKIRFYCSPDNEAARQCIADAGLARVRREHLIEHRAAQIESILDQYVPKASIQVAVKALPDAFGLRAEAGSERGFVLTATRNSLVFTMAQAEQLARHHAGAALYVVCEDDEAAHALGDHGAGFRLLTPAMLSQWGLNLSLDGQVGSVARLCAALFDRQRDLLQLDWVGADLSVHGTVPALPGACQLGVGRWYFGHDLAHAVEQLGPWTSSYLSLTRQAAQQIQNLSLAGSAEPSDWIALCAQQSVVVQAVEIDTPWAEGADASHRAVALLGPLAYVDNSRWQFLPYQSAHAWQDYLNRIYVPHLQHLQALYARVPDLIKLGDQSVRASAPVWTDYFGRHEFRVKGGYRMLSHPEYNAFAQEISGWDTPSVAAIQHASFRHLLDEFKAGRQRGDMRALTQIFHKIAGPGSTVLEEGCGSGYNSELIRLAAGPDVQYTGIDIAHSMVNLARQTYPGDTFEVMQSENLRYEDGQFDIVLNGASLMHTIDYDKALDEARRVASRYVVLHTVTVADTEANVHFEKNAYGSRVPEVCFSAKTLNKMLDDHRLMPVQIEDSIQYDLSQVVGVPSRSVSVACYCLPPTPKQANHYCTYFDANYLPRGVLMIRSLKRYDPTAVVYVLCFDDPSYKAMMALNLDGVRPIALSELLEADPEFAQARENRTQIEWYFTATSCWVNFLVNKLPDVPRIIYLDADLYFYASPEFLIDEARDASVHIIEHRFSPHLVNLVAFGRFNVGWIGFTSSEQGRRVISDYRANCLEWCYDRLEGDRFGDQKYLDKWPADYADCRVSQIKGANVAWWNLHNAQPRQFGDRVYVGSDQLIFFHFQEIKRLDSGQYVTKKDPAEYGAYHHMVYAPYVAELSQVDAEVRPLIEDYRIRDIRYQSW